jgi:hypothetical protein
MKLSSIYSSIILFFTLFISCFSTASPLPYFVIYDTDGVGRETIYDHGPISSVMTTSASARQFSIYIFRNTITANCNYANIFELDTGERLADGPIVASGENSTTLVANIAFKDDILQKNKVVRLSCSDNDGNIFGVEHKIAGAPKIDWTSNVTPAGNWVPTAGCERAHCNPGFGHFEALNYNATIIVNNNTEEGTCHISQEKGASIGLFNGKQERTHFYSDYFATNLMINAYEPPVILHRISCQNPGGTTVLTQAWEVVDNSIRQIENSTFIQ